MQTTVFLWETYAQLQTNGCMLLLWRKYTFNLKDLRSKPLLNNIILSLLESLRFKNPHLCVWT